MNFLCIRANLHRPILRYSTELAIKAYAGTSNSAKKFSLLGIEHGTSCSGGSKGGARDSHLPRGQILSFSFSLRPKNRLARPLWELAPLSGKSWIRHCLVIHSDTFLTELVGKVLTEGYLTLPLFVHQLTFGLK